MTDLVQKITAALGEASNILERFQPGNVAYAFKQGDDPVTQADRTVDEYLRSTLPVDGEGWLSEETADSELRLSRKRVWIVDPLDGTREFVTGIPEFCVSIALIEDGAPVAGGIRNPMTDETIVGAAGHGVTYNGTPARVTEMSDLSTARVLASRSEVKRGEWERFENDVQVVPTGSVAYKLGLVAAGRADATWTLVPKHEWDIAAGVALVLAAGGVVQTIDGTALRFNSKPIPKLSGLIAMGPGLVAPVGHLLGLEHPVAD